MDVLEIMVFISFLAMQLLLLIALIFDKSASFLFRAWLITLLMLGWSTLLFGMF